MGGTGAPDDLDDGWRTQAWLAAGPDAAAHGSGGYWHHRRRQDPHPQTADAGVQDELLVKLPSTPASVGEARTWSSVSSTLMARRSSMAW